MPKNLKNNHGFSLIEVIAVLLLVGLLASVAGLGIAWSVRGYITARENVAISQKAQLALLRLQKEFTALSDIKLDTSAGSSSGSCIIYKAETISADYRIIRYNGVTEELEYFSPLACTTCPCLSESGNTLADNLSSSTTIRYYKTNGDQINPVDTTYPASDIGAIEVTMEFNRRDNSSTHTFTVTASPRNNKNLNAPGFAS